MTDPQSANNTLETAQLMYGENRYVTLGFLLGE